MTVSNDTRYALTLSDKSVSLADNSKKIIPKGSILKIQTMDEYGEFTFVDEMDYESRSALPQTHRSSSIEQMLFLSPEIRKFAMAIESPTNRIKFCLSKNQHQYILQLKTNASVKIPQGAFITNEENRSLLRAFVRYIGALDGLGPGSHFIVTILSRDWRQIPNKLQNIISKYTESDRNLSVIVSAEFIYNLEVNVCPENVELFHMYRENYNNSRMSRNSEPNDKLTKSQQAHNKRNSSNIIFDSANNKNTSKTVPAKPFNVNGKDIYVIDSTPDTDSADVQIVEGNQYEDLSAILSKTQWPEIAGPQFEMLNGKSDETSNSVATKSLRSSARTKSSNLLDHFNYDSRNANREALPSGGHSKYALRSHARDTHNYDNDVNRAISVDERPDTFMKIPGSTLGIDAMVTVETGSSEPVYGVIRAIFKIGSIVMVGVEIEDFIPYIPVNLTDGTFSGHRFFHCQNGKALFIEADCCHKDNRFSDDFVLENKSFGHPESPVVTEDIPPISMKNLEELEEIIGESKGIQGHNNSCYLDATLFSMFTFAQCFDSLLYRSAEKKDIKHYDQVRAILRDEIVHPLRKHHFVRADRVLKLRELLEEISTMTGLTNEEKDPEEFMNILMAQTLRAEPYLKFNSGQDAFYCQLFVEKNDELALPNVQQLFEQSFKTSNIKLREVPPCLIIQMPRFGKSYKMYPRIVPSQVLDITDVVEGRPRGCDVCAKLANCGCLDCSKDYCAECFQKLHQHHNQSHNAIDIRSEYPTLQNYQTVPRIHMDLFAVVCIETSHYVSFVKAGELPDAPWLFFDSMSDRRGGQNGYNIPSMVSVPDLPVWLSEEGARQLHDSTPKDKLLPPFAKRLLCDAYMCMYVSRMSILRNIPS